ncbi:TVP38/TMEM64 family protein [Promicromonospora aerolata]|uniref:TVP38/TMEM64 family membrane protein n=1 Tax=Promicromonospora aerolata TaxID=195749 RepID=A0ABW4V470_9MICO
MNMWGRLAGLVLLLLVGVVLLIVVPLPTVPELHAQVAAFGAWAPVLFIAGYVVATLLLLPKNVLSAAAGLAFGLPLGVTLVWIGAMLGAAASFWLGRALGRDGVARLAGRHMVRLDGLVRRHGVLAVLVARLIPIVPFTAVNYGSGLTAVGFPAYLLATAVGILPGTVAYVAVGAYGTDPGGWQFLVAAGALLVLSVGGAAFARRRSRTAGRPDAGPDVSAVTNEKET